jgi:diadenosine tetraphosphate (Ap4A) HIT family hydrolase
MCHLCAQIAGKPEGDLLHKVLAPAGYRRIVCVETPDFVVITSIGPLVRGHVLLVPKRHVRSFASLSARDLNAGDELAGELAAALADVYDQPVHRFEHGSARCGSTVACSVEHAHLHLVPTAADPWPLIRNAGPWVALRNGGLADSVGDREYLLYEQPDGHRRVWITGEAPIASQLMRQAFATAIGIPELWDWRVHPRTGDIRSTFSRVSGIELEKPRGMVQASVSV